jgi:hypothetical protein
VECDSGSCDLDRWCLEQIATGAPRAQRVAIAIATGVGDTHVLSYAPGQRPAVLVIPGTNFNAATCPPLARALAARWPT